MHTQSSFKLDRTILKPVAIVRLIISSFRYPKSHCQSFILPGWYFGGIAKRGLCTRKLGSRELFSILTGWRPGLPENTDGKIQRTGVRSNTT